ncbi:S8 family serine peptidase [Nonomuraea sp. NPDC050404]|uniref:S8 family peptidase n=1 Tax=Nonomuraea sp. NPDC050404 TaxID=3155783 RepID=UPI0034060445
MSDEKLSDAYRQVVARAADDEVITALIRTKPADPNGESRERALAQLAGERLATRRSELLSLVGERYAAGKDYQRRAMEVPKRDEAVISAAPSAHRLWLADAIAVSGTPGELADLATHENVTEVFANPRYSVPRVLQTPLEDSPESVDGSTWGVARIGAPEVWAGLGRGDGVLIGHLDTGVDNSHPALTGKVSAFQEFNSLGGLVVSTPHDSGSHGTHTAGTLVGRTVRGLNIGVAPEARLLSALVLPGGSGTFAQIVAGMEWAIRQGAHVINMSLGGDGYSQAWNVPIRKTVLSGVVVVASIGNSGHGTSGGPGNDPLCVGVGATHAQDQVAGFSGGQSLSVQWFDERLQYIKPDISAPGVRVVSSVPGGGLAAFNGTSMAAPHVAGAVALLQSTEKALRGDPFATRAILLGTVEDHGEAGRDQRFGFGRLDAQSSAEQAVAFL